MNLSLEAANRLYFIGEVDELTDVIDNCVDEQIEEGWLRDEAFLPIIEKEKAERVSAVSFYPGQEATEPLELRKTENKLKPSVNEPPKELPSHLEYAFLQGEDQLPVIINSSLEDKKKDKLL